MANKTYIAWTRHTFNISWGCTKVGTGCDGCYADSLSHRYGYDLWGPRKPRRTFGEEYWREPLKWNRLAESEGERHRVFCSSMCDIFEDHPTIDQERVKLWPLIAKTPWLDWQLLTKRAKRIAANLPTDWDVERYHNVWLGVSIENNDYVERADHLRVIPAAQRFISYEPALGPLDKLDLTGINWLIYGGESGPHYRKHDIQWARDMRDRCAAAGVAFFFKQSAARFPSRGTLIDGVEIKQFPARRISLNVIGESS